MKPRGLRASISHVRRHPWLHTISVATISVALLLLGGFFFCYRNLESIAEKTNPHVTGTLYLKEALSDAQVKALREQVLSQPAVAKVQFKSKGSVVKELHNFLGTRETEVLPGSELFPDILDVELAKETDDETVAALKARLAHLPEVAEVDFSEDWLAQYNRFAYLAKVIGILLMVAILLGSSFIIANFMGMRHQARAEEIEIVRLMGAHRGFILTPFLLEGVFEGVMGASIALTLLYGLKAFLTAFQVPIAGVFGISRFVYLSPGQFVTVIAVGIAMAFISSLTVFLRFREDQIR
jgi:cell division transport system permease protein